MLRDEIEKRRRENPGSLETKRGGCKFCGQIASMELPEEWEQQFINEAATELCNCYEAKNYTRKKGQKERAIKAIEKQFGEEAADNQTDEEIKDLLIEIVDLIVEDKINTATIDIGNGLKAKIGITAKGAVKVERTMTEKTTQEA